MSNQNGRFSFTVTDLGRFLGKAPATLRKWEKQGDVSFPRNQKGDRRVNLDELVNVAKFAYESARITPRRFRLIEEAAFILKTLEGDRVRQEEPKMNLLGMKGSKE